MAPRKITRQDMTARRREVQELGQVGSGRRNRHAQLHLAGGHHRRRRNWCKKGKVISLCLNFDHTGPQGAKSKYPSMGRTNAIHTMLRTGTDAYSGVLDKRGIRAADDMVTMPLQCGTQWDGLGHVFYENYMWNGYDCREVTSRRRAEMRHRKDQEQDGRPRRVA